MTVPVPLRRLLHVLGIDQAIGYGLLHQGWAIAIQPLATPRPSRPKVRATGPLPLRTARGAGRLFARELDVRERALEARVLARERVLRDRVLEPVFVPLREDVLLLRDPGGEDVRVAMAST